jgi:hypothetical protein
MYLKCSVQRIRFFQNITNVSIVDKFRQAYLQVYNIEHASVFAI